MDLKLLSKLKWFYTVYHYEKSSLLLNIEWEIKYGLKFYDKLANCAQTFVTWFCKLAAKFTTKVSESSSFLV